MASRLKLILGVFLAIALAACGEYGKIYKSKDSQAKYKLAMSLYEEKNFSKAVPLFEQLRDAYRNNLDSLEDVYIRSAYSYFYMKDYEYASMFFKDFTDNFSRSSRMTECAYMALYCDVLFVGDPDLDQSKTSDVIEALQTFIAIQRPLTRLCSTSEWKNSRPQVLPRLSPLSHTPIFRRKRN
jgi:outer membrane protein assembly factor BamD